MPIPLFIPAIAVVGVFAAPPIAGAMAGVLPNPVSRWIDENWLTSAPKVYVAEEPSTDEVPHLPVHVFRSLRKASHGLTAFSQVDMLVGRYKSVNFGAEKRPGPPNW
ncbi:hypothetical protein T484DRAFT_2279202 [Baffinella frigidus]|nr:hypothetical protein T484DRAFT_2279202 [Cryptophyta sp. CCMP2293]